MNCTITVPVQLPAVPPSVSRDALRGICRLLGLDPGDVRELRVSLNEVTARLYLSTADGHKVRYGDDAATTEVTIPID